MSSKYSRSFIALDQDNSDYTIKGKRAVGKAIIEINKGKGKVLFSVSNLKSEIMYKAYIVSADSNNANGIYIGSIKVDENGNGDLKFECDATNVCESNLALEKFNIACVIFVKSHGVITPLAGYKDSEISWKNNFNDLTNLADKNKSLAKEENLTENIKNDEIKEENSTVEEIKTEKEVEIKENNISAEETIEYKAKTDENDDNTTEETDEIEKKEAQVEIFWQEPLEEDEYIENLEEEMPKENMDILSASQEEQENIMREFFKEDEAIEEAAEEVEVGNLISNLFNNADYEDIPDPIDYEEYKTYEFTEKKNYDKEFDKPNEQLHKSFLKIAEKFKTDLKGLEEFTNLDERKSLDRYDNNGKMNASEKIDIFEDILENNIKAEPFKDLLESEKWVNITLNDLNKLPDKFKVLINNLTVINNYNKYKHLTIGKNINTNRYFLGVPGGFNSKDEKFMKESGFHLFKCCDYGNVNEGKDGYWIMIVNKDY